MRVPQIGGCWFVIGMVSITVEGYCWAVRPNRSEVATEGAFITVVVAGRVMVLVTGLADT